MSKRLVILQLASVLLVSCPQIANAQWSPTGVDLSPPGNDADAAQVCSDGLGGGYVVWHDSRSGEHTYLQHLDRYGHIVPGWPTYGLRVSTSNHSQYDPFIVSDGSGGAFLSWAEEPVFPANRQFASHVLYSGAIAPGWPSNGVQVIAGTSDQSLPQMFPDGSGGMYVVLLDNRDYAAFQSLDIYIQHLTATGAYASGWPGSGKPIVTCPDKNRAETYCAARDSAGGFVVAWGDGAVSPAAVRIQRIDATGERVAGWDACGQAIVTGLSASSGVVGIGPTTGGFIFGMVSLGGYNQFDVNAYTLGLDYFGNRLPAWTSGPKYYLYGVQNQQSDVQVTPDGHGGLFAAWSDYRYYNAAASDVYVQHVDASGDVSAGWPLNGAQATVGFGFEDAPYVVADGTGGAYVTFYDDNSGVSAQHMVAGGMVAPGWNPAGEVLSSLAASGATMRNRSVISDGNGGAITALDLHSFYISGVFAQHIGKDAPVPTTLSLVSWEPLDGGVRIEWSTEASGVQQIQAYRRTADTDWLSLGTLLPDGSGNIVLEDHSVLPGTQYDYRLGYSLAGSTAFTSETWLALAGAPRFALAGATPNPATGREMAIRFMLPRSAPAILNLYDVTGRRLLSREVGTLGAGEHLVRMGDGQRIAAGIYWATLTQANQHATAKVVVVN